MVGAAGVNVTGIFVNAPGASTPEKLPLNAAGQLMLWTVKFVVPVLEMVSTFCALVPTDTLPKLKLPAKPIVCPMPVPETGSDFVPLVAEELTVTVPV